MSTESGEHEEHEEQLGSFWERLQEDLNEKLETSPTLVSVVDVLTANFVPAFAIRTKEVASFKRISRSEIDQPKEITLSTSLFGEDGAAEVGDIRSKTILSKNCKSFKVPKVRLEKRTGESDDSDNDDASVMASPHSPQPDTSAGQDLSGVELSPDSAKKLAALAHEPQRRKDFLEGVMAGTRAERRRQQGVFGVTEYKMQ
ncbi:hypothetical protein OS493_029291 [Desmophyllum pertusum]|uniref:Uncharacterized protein n=1 Tax=Desmophyllum pertusum TaxID=174260 RepID=A0A9W9ZB09_9CNID|nr:hypothetical protein OS493_029291 [Desmophyllum pertusum]